MNEEDGSIIVLNHDAFILTQWLEKGVFEALNEDYIRSMIFTIFTKHPDTGEQIALENYEFKMIEEGEDELNGSETDTNPNTLATSLTGIKTIATKEQLKARGNHINNNINITYIKFQLLLYYTKF